MKKLLSIVLTLAMLLSCAPLSAFAEATEEMTEYSEEQSYNPYIEEEIIQIPETVEEPYADMVSEPQPETVPEYPETIPEEIVPEYPETIPEEIVPEYPEIIPEETIPEYPDSLPEPETSEYDELENAEELPDAEKDEEEIPAPDEIVPICSNCGEELNENGKCPVCDYCEICGTELDENHQCPECSKDEEKNNDEDEQVFTITYYANKGTAEEEEYFIEEFAADEQIIIAENTFTNEEQKFASWNTVAVPEEGNYGETFYEGAAIDISGYEENTLVLYAQWEEPEDEEDGEMIVFFNHMYFDNDSITSEKVAICNTLIALQPDEAPKTQNNSFAMLFMASPVYGDVTAAAALRNAMVNRQSSITLSVNNDSGENTSALCRNIVYMATRHTGNPKEGDYITWQGLGIKVAKSGTSTVTLSFTMTYATTLAQENSVDSAVASLKAELGLNSKSDYEKIRSVYNWITKNINYNYNAGSIDHTAYAAIINKRCVCQGYAQLFYRMMLEVGIDARVVRGFSNGGGHAWNIVKLDGIYYYADATWDEDNSESNYNYFLDGRSHFELSHIGSIFWGDSLSAGIAGDLYQTVLSTSADVNTYNISLTPYARDNKETTYLTASSQQVEIQQGERISFRFSIHNKSEDFYSIGYGYNQSNPSAVIYNGEISVNGDECSCTLYGDHQGSVSIRLFATDEYGRQKGEALDISVNVVSNSGDYYTISYYYDSSAGSEKIGEQKTGKKYLNSADNKYYGDVTLLMDVPEREGFMFVGWTSTKGTFAPGTYLERIVDGNLLLTAVWEAKSVYVTYDANGGTVPLSGKTVLYSETYGLIPNPSRNGYTFLGWYTARTGGEKITSETIVSRYEGHTIYAHWADTITVTVHFVASDTGRTLAEDYVKNYQLNEPIDPVAAKESSIAGYEPQVPYVYFDGEIATQDIEITIFYDPVGCRVNFDPNEGTSEQSFADVVFNSPYGPLPSAERTGYDFQGWYTEPSGGTKIESTTIVSIPVAHTLYAHWEPITYSVTYNANGGSGTMSSQTGIKYDTEIVLNANRFTRKGYIFSNWNTMADGSGEWYINRQSAINLSSEKGAKVVLYAQWTPIEYTVIFDGNGGIGEMESLQLKYDKEIVPENTFSKEGYTFSGWNTRKDGSGTKYDLGAAIKNLTTTAGREVTLYAQWAANNYTIIFDGNGATSGTMLPQTHTYGKSLALTANAFQKADYAFIGWAWEKESAEIDYANKENVINLTSSPNEELTLYAIWQPLAGSVELRCSDFGDETVNGKTYDVDMSEKISVQITAEIMPADALQTVTWETNNSAAADVNAGGTVTFNKPGSVTITARSADGSDKYAEVSFNVKYKDSAEVLTATADIPPAGLPENSSCELRVYGAGKDPLDPLDFDYTVMNGTRDGSEYLSVDNSGRMTCLRAGVSVKVTAALRGDPLNRCAIVTVKLIPVQVAEVMLAPDGETIKYSADAAAIIKPGFYGINASGEIAAGPEDTESYALYVNKIPKGNPSEDYSVAMGAKDSNGHALSSLRGKFTWATTNTKLATVTESGEGIATITVKPNVDGACVISAISKDAAKAKNSISLYIMDYSPKIGATSITINTYKNDTVNIPLVESYGNRINTVKLMEYNAATKGYDIESENFDVSYAEDKVEFRANGTVLNKTLKAQLVVTCEDGNTYKYNINVISRTLFPTITVSQAASETFRLLYTDSKSHIKVTAKSGTTTETILRCSVDETYNRIFSGSGIGNEAVIGFALGNETFAPKSKSIKLLVEVEGWDEPIEKVFTLKTNSTKPNYKLSAASATINPLFGNISTTVTLIDSKTSETVALSDNAIRAAKEYDFVSVEQVGNSIKLNLKGKTDAAGKTAYSGGAVQIWQQQDGWTTYIPYTYTLKVTANGQLPKATLKSLTGGKLNLDSTVAGIDFAEYKVDISDSNYILDEAKTLSSKKCTGLNSAQAEKIILNYDSEKQSFIAVLNKENLPAAGTYKFSLQPYVKLINDETAESVPLNNLLAFSVSVYKGIPSVTVSAQGKIDVITRDRSSISYSVTKTNNFSGEIKADDTVQLSGKDAEMFNISHDKKGQISLRLKNNVPCSTAKTYTVRLRYQICAPDGRISYIETKNLSIKPVQSAVKLQVTPSSQVYYQSQSRSRTVRYTVNLTSPEDVSIDNIDIGNVSFWQSNLADKTKRIDIVKNGSRAYIDVTLKDTSIFNNGKTYTLPLLVTAKNSAENVAPAKINLTLKINK